MPTEHNHGDTITSILSFVAYDLDLATKINTIAMMTNLLHYTFLLVTKLVG
jgi:hypothetical protein